jgi:hypothetical protein
LSENADWAHLFHSLQLALLNCEVHDVVVRTKMEVTGDMTEDLSVDETVAMEWVHIEGKARWRPHK